MGAVRQAFAKNLAHHRERLGWTQAKLAEMVDTSASYIGHLERGEREPSLLTIEELSKALKVQPGEFFVLRDKTVTRDAERLELEELMRGRPPEDLKLVIRLARAAFEHPRLQPAEASLTKGRPTRRGKG